MPRTSVGAGEVAAIVEGCATGTLGSAPAAAAEEVGPATEKVGPIAELGPGVEVPAEGVGPWRTCGWKEWAPLVVAIVGPEE